MKNKCFSQNYTKGSHPEKKSVGYTSPISLSPKFLWPGTKCSSCLVRFKCDVETTFYFRIWLAVWTFAIHSCCITNKYILNNFGLLSGVVGNWEDLSETFAAFWRLNNFQSCFFFAFLMQIYRSYHSYLAIRQTVKYKVC